jgi:L-ribulose-5-phosphate 4-epimerase
VGAFDQLKSEVCQANRQLAATGLVVLTWGNVSGIDRDQGVVAIKPSGVAYESLTPADIVVVDLAGAVVEGELRPSADTPTHLALYRAWDVIGGVTHTHSACATMFAQACRPIPCLGTTHADSFYGEIPVTRSLTEAEVAGDYETNTGAVIVERFAELSPVDTPAVLVANHGPFAWAAGPTAAAEMAVVVEEVARMALGAMQINPEVPPLMGYLVDKHHQRKHGPDAYYGQQ